MRNRTRVELVSKIVVGLSLFTCFQAQAQGRLLLTIAGGFGFSGDAKLSQSCTDSNFKSTVCDGSSASFDEAGAVIRPSAAFHLGALLRLWSTGYLGLNVHVGPTTDLDLRNLRINYSIGTRIELIPQLEIRPRLAPKMTLIARAGLGASGLSLGGDLEDDFLDMADLCTEARADGLTCRASSRTDWTAAASFGLGVRRQLEGWALRVVCDYTWTASRSLMTAELIAGGSSMKVSTDGQWSQWKCSIGGEFDVL